VNQAVKPSRASPEARVAASRWRAAISPAIVVLVALVALYTGKVVSDGHLLIGLVVALALAGLAAFRYMSLAGWCCLLLLTTIAARGMSAVLGLPSIVDFLHYPVVVGFALAAFGRPRHTSSRAPARWIAGLLLVVLLAAIAHPDNPLRTLLFLLIAGEPFVVIWALARWGVDQKSLRTIGIVAVALAAIQIPIGVYQGLTYGWTDPVQGTLSGHGAGHHVLGALFAIAFFVIVSAVLARGLNPIVGIVSGGICLAMTTATGSMAVLLVAVVAAVAGPLLGGSDWARAIQARKMSSLILVLALGAAALVFTAAWVPGIYDRASDLATSRRPPEIEILRDRAASDPLAFFLGSGPGTSGSRASLLLIDVEEGSPLAFLDLEPTDLGIRILNASSDELHGGSVESAPSSALAVVGDLGLIGLVGFVALLFAIWMTIGRSESWMVPAARSSILMVGALSLLDNWLEYPEFAVPFGILVGLVVSAVPEEAQQGVSSAARGSLRLRRR
jgi:hypothetical protein